MIVLGLRKGAGGQRDARRVKDAGAQEDALPGQCRSFWRAYLTPSGVEEGELFQSRVPLAVFVQLRANIKAVQVFFLRSRTL